jgi:hypothetical protein
MVRELSGRVTFRVFKRGILSRVAHDIQLSMGAVKATLEDGKVCAELPLSSFIVDGALQGGLVVAGVISAKDSKDILKNMHSAVLKTEIYPNALIEGNIDSAESLFRGHLTLRGRSVEIAFPLNAGQNLFEGAVEIVPTRWGIAPYRALLGTLQLQDRVEVFFQFGPSGR